MSDTGPPPVIPDDLQQYNSYAIDPRYQITFTIVWTSVLTFAIIAALPAVIWGNKRWRGSMAGVMEDWKGRYTRLKTHDGDDDVAGAPKKSCCARRNTAWQTEYQNTLKTVAARAFATAGAMFYWTPPFSGGLSLGQLILIAAYLSTVLACTLTSVPLSTNSNRAGFLALAQLPPLFLLSAKSSPLALLLPPHFSYTRLNFLHRWAARGVLLCVVIHGAFWIADHRRWGLPILGQQKETSGVAALGVICVISLASWKVVREKAWAMFYWVHFLGFPAFFITVCYHTPYASPWIFPPIAIYAFDLFMRSIRVRVKDAFLFKVDNQMTIIHIPDCDTGFRAGQHLRLRIFFEGRGAFEAHPFSVMCAPSTPESAMLSSVSCVRAMDVHRYWRPDPKKSDKPEIEQAGETEKKAISIIEEGPAGIVLGARVGGDWTSALNAYAQMQEDRIRIRASSATSVLASSSSSSAAAPSTSPPSKPIPVPVQVMFDGPYGGCGLDLVTYDRVLLVAGGSGATFAIGMLDEIVGTCVNARHVEVERKVRTRRVDFVWCIRSYGSIAWFAPLLSAIACASRGVVYIRILVYVTCLCVPEAVPSIPGLEVRVSGRPNVRAMLRRIMDIGAEDGEDVDASDAGGGEELDLGECCGCGCVQEALEEQEKGRQGRGKKGKEKENDDPEKVACDRFQGRVAVCASGPPSMTRDAANAVARYAGRSWGVEVGLHTEVFAI